MLLVAEERQSGDVSDFRGCDGRIRDILNSNYHRHCVRQLSVMCMTFGNIIVFNHSIRGETRTCTGTVPLGIFFKNVVLYFKKYRLAFRQIR